MTCNPKSCPAVVWDAEGLQQTPPDGHPGQADAEDHQVLTPAQGHPEAFGGGGPQTVLGPNGNF